MVYPHKRLSNEQRHQLLTLVDGFYYGMLKNGKEVLNAEQELSKTQQQRFDYARYLLLVFLSAFCSQKQGFDTLSLNFCILK